MNYETTKSGILMPANSTRPVMREVATTRDGRDITRGYVDPFMLQQPSDSVLQLRGGGDYKIYKEVLRDDQVKSCFEQRRLAVVAKEIQVDAGGTSHIDKKAADFTREQIAALPFDKKTDLMLYGVFYGYSVAEVMWGYDGPNVIVDKLNVRDRVRFGYDGFGNLRLRTFDKPEGELVPDKKFWNFCTGADHDDEPYGIGLAHWLYWPVFFKRAGIQYWMIFLERFGQPTTVGKHPANATPEEKQKLLNALEAVAVDTGITIPDGMEISFLEAARSGVADYVKLCEYMDAAIAKIILGQTASTQGTPGRLGNDDLQGDVRADLTRADADLMCESYNQTVVKWQTQWNFPGAKPPRVYRVTDEEEDQNEMAERDTKIHALGFKPTLKHITDTYGGEWVETKENTDKDKKGLPAPGEKAQAENAEFADPDTSVADSFTDQLDDRLQSFTDVWIKRIKKLVTDAESLEDIRDGLAALLPDMDLKEYAAVMGEALRVAQLTGRSDLMDEVSRGS